MAGGSRLKGEGYRLIALRHCLMGASGHLIRGKSHLIPGKCHLTFGRRGSGRGTYDANLKCNGFRGLAMDSRVWVICGMGFESFGAKLLRYLPRDVLK